MSVKYCEVGTDSGETKAIPSRKNPQQWTSIMDSATGTIIQSTTGMIIDINI
jgi:hypothetical protein